MTTETTTKLEITNQGKQAIRDGIRSCEEMPAYTLEEMQKRHDVTLSLLYSLAQVINLGGYVNGDTQENLWGRNSWLDYGMVRDSRGTWSVNS